MKPKRPPPDLPSPGDRVRLRGRAPTGDLVALNPDTGWSFVAWDWEAYLRADDLPPPLICHRYELQRLEAS